DTASARAVEKAGKKVRRELNCPQRIPSFSFGCRIPSSSVSVDSKKCTRVSFRGKEFTSKCFIRMNKGFLGKELISNLAHH
ncbi:hypothetical protein AVEN_28235-1, partial [Araneus ventricosus]